MVDVSLKALDEFQKVLDAQETKGLGIKIKAHVSDSCSCCGPSQAYEMDLVEKGDAADVVIEKKGIRFYLDDESARLMDGFEVDFMDEHGFIVKDTNAPSCGCGGGDHGHEHGGGSCCG